MESIKVNLIAELVFVAHDQQDFEFKERLQKTPANLKQIDIRVDEDGNHIPSWENKFPLRIYRVIL